MLKVLLLLLTPQLTTAAPDLTPYKWKARVLVLRDTNQSRILAAREKLKRHAVELHERDVVILEERSGETFKIELFGKDGGKKWQGDQAFKVETIIELIDSMPMRKEEATK
jgi:hypothetical protein